MAIAGNRLFLQQRKKKLSINTLKTSLYIDVMDMRRTKQFFYLKKKCKNSPNKLQRETNRNLICETLYGGYTR